MVRSWGAEAYRQNPALPVSGRTSTSHKFFNHECGNDPDERWGISGVYYAKGPRNNNLTRIGLTVSLR